jgi:hypothetical protein
MKRFLRKAGAGLVLGVVTLVNLPLSVAAAVTSPATGKLTDILKPSSSVGNLDFTQIVPMIINVIFVVAAGLTFFYLVFGAISWITSGGEKSKVEAARGKITAAVIGLLILASCWAVFSLLMRIFFKGGDMDLPVFNT